MRSIIALILLATLAISPCTTAAQAHSYDQVGNGYLGVYGDAAGTQTCITAPAFTPTNAYVISTLADSTANGVTGVEFRIEVSPSTSGYIIQWTANPGLAVSLGYPIDADPEDPNNAAGCNLAFVNCQPQTPGERINWGTLSFIALSANPTPLTLRVKQKTPPSLDAHKAPLFVLCDAPANTVVNMTLTQDQLGGREPVAFISYVNNTLSPCLPPPPPAAPMNVLASLFNGTQIQVTWTAATDTIDGYNVYRQLDGGSFAKINTALITTPSFFDSVPPTGTLCYQVLAQRSGVESSPGGPSCLGYVPPPPPSAPTNVLASLFNGAQIQVTWTAATGFLDGYNVYRQLNGGGFGKINAALVTTLSYTDTAPLPGSLCYQVLAAQRSGVESSPGGPSCLPFAQPPDDQIGNGYVGVYGDAAGTQTSITAAPFTPTTLYVVSTLADSTALGVTGVEFRIEVSPAPGSNYILSWTANPNLTVALGSPIDDTPADPNDAKGCNLWSSTCQPTIPGEKIQWGTISILALTTTPPPLTLKVKQKSPPSAPNHKCPLFTLCDAPVYTAVNMTLTQDQLGGREPVAFISYVNLPPPPPAAPTNVLASLFNSTQIRVSWTAATGIIDGYNIYRQLDGGSFAKVNAALVTTLSFTDSAPPTGTLCYQVLAQRSGLESAPAGPSCLVFVPPPTSVVASLFNGTQIQVTWTAAGGTIDGYNVYRQLNGGGLTKINAALVTIQSFIDSAPPTGTLCYQVLAQRSGVESAPAGPSCLVFVPPPTNVVASLFNSTQIRVSWTVATGTVDGYNVYRQLNGGGFTKINAALVTTQSFIDSAPPTGTLCYRVLSQRSGVESSPGGPSCLGYAPPPPPAAPTNVLASLFNGTQIQVTWTAAAGTIDGYNVYRQLNGGSFAKINAAVVTTPSFIDSAPPTGTLCYRVLAQRSGVESAPAGPSCLPFARPPFPQQLCYDLIGNGTIGIYADAAATSTCITAAPFTPTRLYVYSKLAGASAFGITGAEFRVEFSPAPSSAYILGWTSNPSVAVSLGNPIDDTPDNPTDYKGCNIAFASCQSDAPGSPGVYWGSIEVTLNSQTALPLALKVKQKSPPSSPLHKCPLLVLCDAPVFTAVNMTLTQDELGGREPVASIAYVNTTPCTPECPQSESSTWTVSGSPYVITREVVVRNGATLRIEPGVVLLFEKHGALVVGDHDNSGPAAVGFLRANGTADSAIVFTSFSDSTNGWKGLSFGAAGDGEMSYCIVEKAGLPNYVGMNANIYSNSTIAPMLNRCILTDGAGAGLWVHNPSLAMSDCAIFGNQVGMINEQQEVNSATGNWWGDASGPYDPSIGAPDHNPNGLGDAVTDNIAYRPWLTSPPDIGVFIPTPLEQAISLDHPSGEIDGTNTALGAVTHRFPLLKLRGSEGNIDIIASYSSASARTSLLGPKWSWTLGQAVILGPDSSATVITDDGGGKPFAFVRSRFVPGTGVYDSLSAVPGGYLLVHPSQAHLSFEASGRMTSIADRNGNAITLTYSGAVPVGFTDAFGRVYSLTVTADRLTQIQDPLSRTWRFEYDASGELSRYTDADGNQTQFSYDSAGRLTQVVDPRGNTELQFTYDAEGRVLSQTDALAGTTTFTYDAATRRTTIMNALQGVRIHLHDANYRLISDTDERGYTTTYAYDFRHNRTQVQNGLGNTTRYEYNLRGNPTRVIDPLGATTMTTYDAMNNPLVRTDALGQSMTFTYDSKGNLLTSTDRLGNTTTYTYNSRGQVLTVTDANGHMSTNTYDAHGNLMNSTNGAGNVTAWTYDAVGRRLTSTDGLSHATTFFYDSSDSLVCRTDPLGYSVIYEYDANGNRTAKVDARGKRTAYAYDPKDRLIRVTNPSLQTTEYTYDAIDRRITITDARGKVTNYAYDASGNQIRETDPLGNQTSHTYDANGNRLTTTDPRGKTTIFAYDSMNRLLTTTDPLGNTTRNAYDGLGRLTSVANPRGKSTEFGYDAVGKLTLVRAPTGAQLVYSYDRVGNRIAMTTANGHATTYAYDNANRLIGITDPLGNAKTFSYDVAGNRIRRIDALGRATDYSYDAANRLVRKSYPDGTSIVLMYDPNGNLTRMTDRWGASSYTYDDLSRLTSHVDHFGQAVTYEYDANGSLATLTYPGSRAVRHVYDDANRLVTVGDWSNRTVGYGYDEAGNITSTSYPNGVSETRAYDDAGRLLKALTRKSSGDTLVSFDYTLDSNGNRVRMVRVDRRDELLRRGGDDVYATSASLSAAAFPAGVDSIVLAAGEDWAEAVGAAQMGRRQGMPALVIPGENLWASSATRTELARLASLRPQLRAIILGDVEGVSEIDEMQMLSEFGLGIRRVGGANRYETAALAASPATTAVLLGAADAARLPAAALQSGRRGWPLLLCDTDSVPSATRSALARLGVTQTILVGDITTIGNAAAAWLDANGYTVKRRFAEADPAALSVALADYDLATGAAADTLALLRRDMYQDALSAGASIDTARTIVLLVHPDSLSRSPEVARWIGQHKGRLQRTILLAGPAGLTQNLSASLRSLLRTTVMEYSYNDLDELLSEVVPGVDSTHYTYDPMGNRASVTRNGVTNTYAYDTADRLISAGSTSLAYDANGNRISRTDSAVTTYTYDLEDRLVRIVGPEGTSHFDYDGAGRRIQSDEPGRTARYVLDVVSKPYRTIQENTPSGETTRSYVHGLGLTSDIGSTGSARYFHFDGLGSTAAITDSVGTDLAHVGYEAFGAQMIALGSADTRLGYVGKWGAEVTASRLVFMRARFYEPSSGLFLSLDPQDGPDQEYLRGAMYLYAFANPTRRIDPDGQWSWPWDKKKKTTIERRATTDVFERYLTRLDNPARMIAEQAAKNFFTGTAGIPGGGVVFTLSDGADVLLTTTQNWVIQKTNERLEMMSDGGDVLRVQDILMQVGAYDPTTNRIDRQALLTVLRNITTEWKKRGGQ